MILQFILKSSNQDFRDLEYFISTLEKHHRVVALNFPGKSFILKSFRNLSLSSTGQSKLIHLGTGKSQTNDSLYVN